jgi:hypothetical protein
MDAARKIGRSGRSGVETAKQDKEQQESPIVWTHCPKCGDTWTVQSVLVPGKCRICGGKPKLQEVVF